MYLQVRPRFESCFCICLGAVIIWVFSKDLSFLCTLPSHLHSTEVNGIFPLVTEILVWENYNSWGIYKTVESVFVFTYFVCIIPGYFLITKMPFKLLWIWFKVPSKSFWKDYTWEKWKFFLSCELSQNSWGELYFSWFPLL